MLQTSSKALAAPGICSPAAAAGRFNRNAQGGRRTARTRHSHSHSFRTQGLGSLRAVQRAPARFGPGGASSPTWVPGAMPRSTSGAASPMDITPAHAMTTALKSGGAAKRNAPPNHPQDPRSRPPSCTSIDSSSRNLAVSGRL
jgi:hypothetical protein